MLTIPDSEMQISTSRSSGPGGQHVNKTSTKVTLKWSLEETQSLSDFDKAYLKQRLQSRLTASGELVLHVEDTKSQFRNIERAKTKLLELVTQSLIRPKKRVKTKRTRGSKERALAQKKQTGQKKQSRKKPSFED